MKITDIKTFNVYTYRTNYVFVKIETDEGISGIGEGTLEYKEHALLGAIEDLKRVLIGQDPREVERICHELYRDSYWRVENGCKVNHYLGDNEEKKNFN